MNAEEFDSYDGLGLADLVRRGDVSAGELLDVAIARVEAGNPELNAVVSRLYDQARAAIAAGLPEGPFTGVPYLLKDLGAHYTGAVTSFGSALFKDFVADHDSEITVRLRRAGLVIFGKTNTPEMGLAASPDVDAKRLGEATLVVIGANVRAVLEARAAALGRELTAGDVERITWARAMDGHTARAADYARSIGVIHRTGRTVARFFTRYDILLSPTMCRPPYPLGVLDMMTDDVEAYTRAILGAIGFTSLFNSAGNPAMSVPLGWSRAGLPIGVQFAAPFGDEAALFRLGAQLEAAAPWAGRRPPAAHPPRKAA